MAKRTKISKLKKGDFFKLNGKKKVYQYDGKVRMYDRWGKYKGWGYSYIPVDDVWSGGKETFADVIVEIGFDY
jgi:hypothetical protein